ncbi:DUF2637 domain-containing protein [Streptomyces sp. NPDC005474]|uniref:DUF2637 domain-containing protein n=1 Tax=Streptomyces sp. NPDC005474 TaxID=3154878 RepID=UPI0034542135
MRAHLARVDAVIIQAVIAGALSFSHLHDLAEAAGQGGWKAWAYPVSVDLLLVASWRRMRDQQRAGQPAGGSRLWFLIALAASLGANIATAGLLDLNHIPASLRVVVAGWPAVAFFGGTLLAHAPRSVEEPAGPVISEPEPEPSSAPTVIDTPRRDELPELPTGPAASEEPASSLDIATPTHVPAVSLPPALIDRAQTIAEEHRTATGQPADPDAVRARLGLPPSMTPSVAAHL